MRTAAPIVTVHGPLPHDNPFYAHVGRIASECAHVEHILDVLIWTMAGVNPVFGACITAQIMGPGGRCRAIITLGKLHRLPDGLLKEVKALMGKSFGVADTRARFVHDPWYIESVENKPAQFRAMPFSDPRYGHQEITQQEVDDALEEIRELREQALAIKQKILNVLDRST